MENLDVLSTRLNDHIKESDRRITEHGNNIQKLFMMVESKLSKASFIWIVGIQITLMTMICGLISTQIADLQKSTNITKENVATIKGKLEPYNIEFVN